MFSSDSGFSLGGGKQSDSMFVHDDIQLTPQKNSVGIRPVEMNPVAFTPCSRIAEKLNGVGSHQQHV